MRSSLGIDGCAKQPRSIVVLLIAGCDKVYAMPDGCPKGKTLRQRPAVLALVCVDVLHCARSALLVICLNMLSHSYRLC